MSDSSRMQRDPAKVPGAPSTPLPYGTGFFPKDPSAPPGDSKVMKPGPGGIINPPRVEANTALIKLSRSQDEQPPESPASEESPAPQESQVSQDSLLNQEPLAQQESQDMPSELASSGLMGLGSNSGTAIMDPDDDQSTEAASARIAQEYRRQVRIKRLAEEIQQAEKDKKREEERKRETGIIGTSESKRKVGTARISTPSAETTNLTNQEPLPADTEQSKRRAEAMTAFAGAERKKGNSPARIVTFAFVTIMLCGIALAAYIFLQRKDEESRKLAMEGEERIKTKLLLQQQSAGIDPERVQALEAKLEQERSAREAAEKKAAAEKNAREDSLRRQEEQVERIRAEREAMIAEARRIQEAQQKLEEENKKRDEELRRKAEEASRLAREKLKKEQAEREQQKVMEKSVAATPQGEVRTNPPQPNGINGKSDLPTGAVRLFCKASDPYGGRLTFHWTQVKGAKVEISEPNAATERNGKWYSQTYFIAREPGAYEFEVSVKNEDGVETQRKYPIEVLPVSALK